MSALLLLTVMVWSPNTKTYTLHIRSVFFLPPVIFFLHPGSKNSANLVRPWKKLHLKIDLKQLLETRTRNNYMKIILLLVSKSEKSCWKREENHYQLGIQSEVHVRRDHASFGFLYFIKKRYNYVRSTLRFIRNHAVFFKAVLRHAKLEIWLRDSNWVWKWNQLPYVERASWCLREFLSRFLTQQFQAQMNILWTKLTKIELRFFPGFQLQTLFKSAWKTAVRDLPK